ncbi:MAG TPA: hypothetical protein VKR06_30890 [Ktedonosporobacter sp.]|nr:hypothetical protein [Ktedonosporobacter sp.]
MLTLTDYTRTIQPHIPPGVISHEAFERVFTLTSHFPADLANRIFDFEIYLGKNQSDLALHFAATSESRRQLGQVSAFDDVAWEKIGRFSQLWCESMSLVQQHTDHVWLAFDLDQPVPEIPVPGFFYCAVSSQRQEDDPASIIRFLASIFRDPAYIACLDDNLTRCLHSIPRHARINQVGFGLLRNHDAIRLQVIGITPQEIPAYLKAVGWAYSTAPLQSVIQHISSLDIVALVIDVSASIYPKIGLECFLNRHDVRWQTLLDHLVKQGLCLPDKRDFLAPYPATKVCQLGEQLSLTRQGLSHIKISYHPEQTTTQLEAKAYLAHQPIWLSPIAHSA